MMHRIEIEEVPAASAALQQWFMSQDLDPASASVVMVHLLARLLVDKSKNPIYLAEGVSIHTALLTASIAEALGDA